MPSWEGSKNAGSFAGGLNAKMNHILLSQEAYSQLTLITAHKSFILYTFISFIVA